MATGLIPDTTPAHTHDAAYVNVGGDAMTGALRITEGTTDTLTLNDPTGYADVSFQNNAVEKWSLANNPSGDINLVSAISRGQYWFQDGSSFLSGGLQANIESLNSDSKIGGQHDSSLLYVDADVDRVGIGTNAPSAKLDVRGNVQVQGSGGTLVNLRDTGAGNTQFGFYDTTDGGGTLFAQDGHIIIGRLDAGGVWAANRLVLDKTTGQATLANLAGTGNRVVEASSTGVLSAANRKDRDLIYDSGLTAAVAEIIVQGIFTSAYRDYEIEAGELQTSAAANVHMRQYSGATPINGNVHYGHVCAGYNTTGVIQTAVYSPATQWHLWLASGTIIVNGRASIRVSGPAIATGTTIYGTMGASFSAGGAWGLFGGTHQAATAYDGFGIFPGSGTIVGRVKVYGVR